MKHATPCGFATAADLPTAFRNAFAGDPLAAFGGIVALNKNVDLATATAITSIDKLLEVIVAPAYDIDALKLLRDRWKNVRILEVGPIEPGKFDPEEFHMHKIVGGFLVQQRDLEGFNAQTIKVVSDRRPTAQELVDLQSRLAGLQACEEQRHRAGQGWNGRRRRRRVRWIASAPPASQSPRPAIEPPGSVAASDAFFPFPDGPKLLLEAGVTAIIHPGGSLRDKESLDVVNQSGRGDGADRAEAF